MTGTWASWLRLSTMPPPNCSTSVNVWTSPPRLTATNVWPTRTLVVFGEKCQAPTNPSRVSASMKSWNVMPPDRLQVPGPTTALKVAGSHASIMLTFLSCCDCVVTLDGLAGCGCGCAVIGEGVVGASESGAGDPVPPLHATANAPNPTRTASRTVIVAPPCARSPRQ